MKIQSPFKDYYDYVEHIYGSDPKIVYARDKLVKDKLPTKATATNGYKTNYNLESINYNLDFSVEQLPNSVSDRENGIEYNFNWLVINGKYYLIVDKKEQVSTDSYIPRYVTETSVFNNSRHSEVSRNLFSRHFGETRDFEYYIGRHHENLDKLSKKIQQPVFIITQVNRAYGSHGKNNVTLSTRVPVLQELGIASIIPANELFQETYTYLMNVIRDSPDLAPPVNVSDTDRIVQHGFDIKQSFRHRK